MMRPPGRSKAEGRPCGPPLLVSDGFGTRACAFVRRGRGDLELVLALIARGADINKPGWAPLHYAATKGSVPIVRELLDKSAYIDAESPNGTTPLMMAAMYGTPEVVKILLEAGADPTIQNGLGLTALDFAKTMERNKESAALIAAFVAGWGSR